VYEPTIVAGEVITQTPALTAPSAGFILYNLNGMRNLQPVTWLIDGEVPAGLTTLICGASEAGIFQMTRFVLTRTIGRSSSPLRGANSRRSFFERDARKRGMARASRERDFLAGLLVLLGISVADVVVEPGRCAVDDVVPLAAIDADCLGGRGGIRRPGGLRPP
jgi:hypothetical protein